MQGLPGDHPLWAVVVIPKVGEGSTTTNQALEATAQLNRQMPTFLARLEEVLASTQRTLTSIEARLGRLEAQPQSPVR